MTNLCKLPSQNKDKFKEFYMNVKLLLSNLYFEKPLASALFSDFNTKFANWLLNGVTNSNQGSNHRFDVILAVWCHQVVRCHRKVINSTTHKMTGRSLCFDFITSNMHLRLWSWKNFYQCKSQFSSPSSL